MLDDNPDHKNKNTARSSSSGRKKSNIITLCVNVGIMLCSTTWGVTNYILILYRDLRSCEFYSIVSLFSAGVLTKRLQSR